MLAAIEVSFKSGHENSPHVFFYINQLTINNHKKKKKKKKIFKKKKKKKKKKKRFLLNIVECCVTRYNCNHKG
jgi:hypothetical protein